MNSSAPSRATGRAGDGGPLIDNHGRPITYLRLAITDRCNLRCRYCMPANGVETVAHRELLSYEELERLVSLFLGVGIEKVRITGGEPFVRRGCIDFLERLKRRNGVPRLVITTNGVDAGPYLDRLKALPIAGLNLSLDTLDRSRFIEMTGRDRLERVLTTLHGALARSIPLKINTVVTGMTSDSDIEELGLLARDHDLSLRFIEQMPFDGESSQHPDTAGGEAIGERLGRIFPGLQAIDSEPGSTARRYSRSGFAGTIGIIEGRSRNFCSFCNKIRVTPQGMLKACLYDDGVLDLRQLVRSGATDAQVVAAVRRCLKHRHVDGHHTERARLPHGRPSMSTIGG